MQHCEKYIPIHKLGNACTLDVINFEIHLISRLFRKKITREILLSFV